MEEDVDLTRIFPLGMEHAFSFTCRSLRHPAPQAFISSSHSQSRQASGYAQIEGINGNTYLTTLGFDAGATTRDIGVLVGLYAGFTLLCLVLMQARMPHSRPRIKNIMRRLSLHR